VGSYFYFLEKLRFQVVGIWNHFTGSDLRVAGSLKAEFAGSKAIFGTDRRSENAACHRARIIEVTETGLRIESRAGFILREGFEALASFIGIVQKASLRISREIGGQASDAFASAFSNFRGALRSVRLKTIESLLQPDRIKLIDGKHTDAALRASGPANQPIAAFLDGFGQTRIDNLDQLSISGGWKAERHILRITQESESEAGAWPIGKLGF
jgi:hypothetical protein